MKKLLGFAIAALLAGSTADAAVLYDGGPINGTQGALTLSDIQGGDTFDLADDSTVTGVQNFGLWLQNGTGFGVPTIEWAISNDPTGGGTIYGSGTAELTLTPLLTPNGFGFNVYSASFSTGSLALVAGNYWLVLGNFENDAGLLGGWDTNGGPSQDWNSAQGFDPGNNCGPFTECSNAFQIVGSTNNDVPEPTTLALIGAGIAGMSRLRRRKN